MKINERGNSTSMPFQMWIDADPEHEQKLQNQRLSYVYEDYLDWADTNGIDKPISKSSFLSLSKRYLSDNNLENQFARKGYVRRGSTEKYVEVDKLTARNFSHLLNVPYQEKDEQIRAYAKMIAGDVSQAAYFYGPPGSGKSTIVKEALDEFGIKARWYKGAVKNVESFVREILWPHRDNEVLVFDDFNFLKSRDLTEIVKAITVNEPVRMVSWISDKKTTQKAAIPDTFQFTSGIIIISNEKVNKAIDDRALSVDYSFDKFTMIQMIGDKLQAFMPTVDMEIKKDALNFMASLAETNDIRTISWRDMNTCVVNRLARPTGDVWKRWTLDFLLKKSQR